MSSQLIQHIQTYVSLSEKDIDALAKHFNVVHFKKKEFLLKEGQVGKTTFFVVKGCLRLFFINEKGTEQITQFAIENWWLADYMSFDRHSPSSFYIQAVEPCDVIGMDAALQDKLFKKVPQLERYFRIVQQKAYAAAQHRIRFLNELSKEDSYQHFTTLFPGFIQRIPQYMLASYLGFTPEYLSELRNKRS